MSFITYAQNFEDLMLWRALKHVQQGFYIDVGAYDPVEYSVTKAFYDVGWHGINVEPVAECFDKLINKRPRDINVNALAAENAGEKNFFLFPGTGLSTTSENEKRLTIEKGYGEPLLTKVRAVTLDDLCAEHNVETIHFLKIDAEGSERDVLRGAALQRYRPWILVIEATAPFTNTDVSHSWQQYVLDRGYIFVYFDGLNKFFVAKEHEELKAAFQLPPNVIDDYVPAPKIALELQMQEALSLLAVRDEMIKAAERAAALAQAELNRVYQSRSWKLTKPLRTASFGRQKAVAGCKRSAKSVAAKLILFLHPIVVKNRPLKSMAARVLDPFRAVKHRVLGVHIRHRFRQVQSLPVPSLEGLSPAAVSADARGVIRGNERIVLLYVEHTASFDRITGVQRVCHKLAAMLESNGETVVLIKLDTSTLRLAPLDADERQNFRKQSGFGNTGDDRLYEPATFESMLRALRGHPRKPWLIIPEVTYHTRHPNPPTSRLIKLARDLGMRVGVIYYDVIPFLTVDAAENARKHANYTSTIGLADIIWPISRYSANHLVGYYQHYDKLSDTDLPVISVATLAEEMDAPRHIGRCSADGRNIVCVGTIDERKNQITLIRAFNKYCASHPNTEWKLKIIGLVRDNYRSTIEREASHNSNIEFHYNASDEDIKRFYVNCDFTVFPSLEEGYGLPVVESLWNVKPCICADYSSLAELHTNGGCVAANTQNVDDLMSAITTLIDDEDFYQAKIEEIMRRPVKTWFEYASGIIADMDRLQFGKPCDGLIYYWVDATLAASSNTGIQRVNRQLARHLIMQGHKLVPIKWDEVSASIVTASEEDLEYLARWNGPGQDGWCLSFASDRIEPTATYLMVELPLNRALDVQEQVMDFFKRRSVRCVSVFYDAIPYKLAALYPPHFTRAHMVYMELLDRMDVIIPISGTSARDLIDYLNTSACRGLSLETRVKTIELSAEFPEVRVAHRAPNSGPNGPCNILAVGTVEPRKNHETLIRAFFEAEKKSARKLRLTIVGGDESFDQDLPEKITALIGNSKDINWIKKASDTLLREQFEQADFTVFPSFEEGFGIPIVESLWFGVPCICSSSGQIGELAVHGGCEMVDVRSVRDLSNAIVRLANDSERMRELQKEIHNRHFKRWDEYAAEVSACIREALSGANSPPQPLAAAPTYELPARPILSICITTYNRADWLTVNLENLMRISAAVRDKIEIVVCDNCSSDHTQDVATRFLGQENFFYHRNTANIGMLGNLPQTVADARGDYVWVIGDDDLMHEGALEKVLNIISSDAPDLINVNYAYTPDPTPPSIENIEQYFATALEIAKGGASKAGMVKDISAFNENFYTAIYTFIVKRKHVQKIFNQDTSGAPFSSLQTCVPSSKYIFARMMELPGYWISEPQITINMNVSWGKYAPLWVLERLPEVYDLAELKGVPQDQADRWRRHTLQMVLGFFKILFDPECDPSFASFDMMRFIRRSRHLGEFRAFYPQLEAIYAEAQARNHPLARTSMDALKAAML